MNKFPLIAFLFFVMPAPANAMSLATPEQILCNSSYVVAGNVLSAASKDCRLEAASQDKLISYYCEPKNRVQLSVRINEVYAANSLSSEKLMPGDVIDILSNSDHIMPQALNRRKAISDNEVSDAYKGKDFIFTISMMAPAGYPSWSSVWWPSEHAWVLTTIKHSNWNACPKLVPKYANY